ncbi:MAG TPA: hypothetical protein PLU04_00600, partial [Anaerolineaceae bacterium]|nr:hypothetical protein [Anaerolineaceae bacterium]HPA32292.1 hypothetical protein [Anaerolineaceae bacterium]
MEEETKKMQENEQEPVIQPPSSEPEILPEPHPHHPPKPSFSPPAPIPPHKRRGRKVLGWLVLILGLFALGLAVEYFLYVRPMDQELKTARAELAVLEETKSRLASAEQDLLDKQAELDVTATSLKDAQVHVALLKVQNDVAVTRLAIMTRSWETATTSLELAQNDLNALGALIPGTDTIVAMQTRLKTAAEAYKDKRYTSAQTELEALSGDLTLLVQRLVK